MQFPECLAKAHFNTTFAGVDISQTWQDLALWEEFFNQTEVKSVVELGTFRGGMTMFFALQSKVRGFNVTSIDHVDQGAPIDQLKNLGVTLLTLDLLSDATAEPIQTLIDGLPKPTVLFIDNGNKPREWQLYVPLLQTGDYAAVHDWGTEFHEHNLTPHATQFLKSESESFESMTRFFSI